MHQTDIMLDIETLGTKPGSVIVTLGVCRFSLDDDFVTDKQEIVINVGTSEKAGMTMSAGTVLWWMGQGEEARSRMADNAKSISLTNALSKLSDYVSATRTKNFRNRINIWANDPDFDIVNTNAAYDAIGALPPWQFWESRSMRTIEELGQRLFSFNKKVDFPRTGTHHAADDDAEYQARVVQEIFKRMKNGPNERAHVLPETEETPV